MLNVENVIYLFAQVFIVSVDMACKEVSKQILKIVYGSVFVI